MFVKLNDWQLMHTSMEDETEPWLISIKYQALAYWTDASNFNGEN